jgi:hypothetical protein
METLAAERGVNLVTENIDDVCFGLVISSDKSLSQFLQQHAQPYNYEIIDGDPVRLVRREVNDDLLIDVEIDESECIRRGDAPAVTFSRIEPSALYRQVEIQHLDPDRDFAFDTQVARHTAAPLVNTTLSITLDFVISAQQARDMAFDVLYRMWAGQLGLQFEHPDLRIEPGDVITLTTTRGTFTCLVDSQTINMPARTNSINAGVLLTSKAVSPATATAPTADPFDDNQYDDDAAWVAAA